MRIRWTEPAAHDLTTICDYVNEHGSPDAARRAALAIYEVVGTLVKFPQRGRPGRKENTRECVVPGLPWIVIYRLREDNIEVIRILHGAQRWP